MTAKEFIDKYMEISIKKLPDSTDEVFQALIFCQAQATNGKWVNAYCYYTGIISPSKMDKGMLIEEKKALAKEELEAFMTKRTGIKGYHGYFKFQDFKLLR